MGTKINIDLFEWNELRSKVVHFKFEHVLNPDDIETFCQDVVIDRYYFDHNKGHYNSFATYTPHWDGWLWFENEKDYLMFKLRYADFSPASAS